MYGHSSVNTVDEPDNDFPLTGKLSTTGTDARYGGNRSSKG